jgi:hypothetical protein
VGRRVRKGVFQVRVPERARLRGSTGMEQPELDRFAIF